MYTQSTRGLRVSPCRDSVHLGPSPPLGSCCVVLIVMPRTEKPAHGAAVRAPMSSVPARRGVPVDLWRPFRDDGLAKGQRLVLAGSDHARWESYEIRLGEGGVSEDRAML